MFDKFDLEKIDKALKDNLHDQYDLSIEYPEFPKKIAFVTHEFGLYPGHGGIASYLYQITSWLLGNTKSEIFVLVCGISDENCDLLTNKHFHLKEIRHGSLEHKRKEVSKILEAIQPGYVECTDYLALCLEYFKKQNNGTVLVTNHHTATKECFEWSSGKTIANATREIQQISKEEREQYLLSDFNISPSRFLASYVQENYQLTKQIKFVFNPFFGRFATKQELYEQIDRVIDLSDYSKSFNICLVTRFEGRKSQLRLVNAVNDLLSKGVTDLKCILAGNTSQMPDGGADYRSLVLAAIGKQHCDSFEVYDFATKTDKDKYSSITDLTVMPSTYENCPMAMIEAVMRGIPVIGSKYSGIADYSSEEMLFDPYLEDDLTKKILNFYLKSSEERLFILQQQQAKLSVLLSPEFCIYPRFNLRKSKL